MLMVNAWVRSTAPNCQTHRKRVEKYKCVLRICLEAEYTSIPCGLQITCLLTFFTKYCCTVDSPQLDFAFLDCRDEL